MKPFRMLNLSAEEDIQHIKTPILGEFPESCRFLDVGAGNGRCSIEVAMRGHIVKAVEWDPVQAIILDANIKLNGNPDIRVVRQVPVGVPGEGLLGNQRTINQLTTGWDHWAVRLGFSAPVDELLANRNWLQIADVVIIDEWDVSNRREKWIEEFVAAGFRVDSQNTNDFRLSVKRSNLSLDV
jgi:hypothetical protein